MGKFAQSAAQYNTGQRGDGTCVAGKWIAENFDEEDLAELTRLASDHNWELIVSLSDDNLKNASLNKHVHGGCVCVGDVPGKSCCPCEKTREVA